nr:hypothetical protein [Tanacetum cinerariifolium]
MMTDRDSSATGTDNRPPMLEEDDFESWKIRMERYIRGKTNGKYMWKAIQTDKSPRPQVTDQPTEAVPHPITRERTDDEYTDAENLKEQFDIQVTQIDLPKHQLNTKFVNNLPAYWSKYLTHTKNVMNMSADNYVDIFTHLRTYEP